MPTPLKKIVAYLDRELAIDKFNDSSANGLQVEGRAEVRKVGLAVDACVPSFRAAAARECDLVIVHHGLIWDGGIRSVRGVARKRLAILLEHDISLYGAHLPLDAHPKLGNNALLAKMLGLRKLSPFGMYKGSHVGFAGELARPVTARDLAARMAKKLAVKTRAGKTRPAPTRLFLSARQAGGAPGSAAGKRLRRVGVVSGGGTLAVTEAAELGLDALFTGEGGHAAELEAEEMGVAIIYAGHYETETPGVKAVGDALKKRFGVRAEFLDVAR